jgi:hypothetical protein
MRSHLLPAHLLALVTACGGGDGRSPPPGSDARADDAHPGRESGAEAAVNDVSVRLDASTGCAAGAVWARMDRQPIFLANPKDHDHTTLAGIDLDGADGMGITIPEVQALLCAGSPVGGGLDGTSIEAWGNSNEVELAYDPGTQLVEAAILRPGYLGTMALPTDPAGPDAGHTFIVGIGPIERDGAPFVIDWTDPSFAAGNLLFNAISYNAGGYPGYYAMSCKVAGSCTINDATGVRQFAIPSINLVLDFDLLGTPAVESTVIEIDMAP